MDSSTTPQPDRNVHIVDKKRRIAALQGLRRVVIAGQSILSGAHASHDITPGEFEALTIKFADLADDLLTRAEVGF